MYPYALDVYPQYLAFPSPFVSQFPSPYQYPGYKEELAPAHQRIKHNSNYWCPLGWIRLFILIATLGGVISSWCIVSNDYNFSSLEPGMLQTRSALIVIFSIWFSLSLLMFLMSVTNFVNLPGIDSKYYLYAFTLIDFLGCLAFIGVGIAAAVKESNLIWSGVGSTVYRQGTFIACAVFAFFTAILQLVSAGYQFYFVYKLDFV